MVYYSVVGVFNFVFGHLIYIFLSTSPPLIVVSRCHHCFIICNEGQLVVLPVYKII